MASAAHIPPLLGRDGQPLVYPIPALVKNSFINVATRSPSFEEYYQERKVQSSPPEISSAGDRDASSDCSTVDTADDLPQRTGSAAPGSRRVWPWSRPAASAAAAHASPAGAPEKDAEEQGDRRGPPDPTQCGARVALRSSAPAFTPESSVPLCTSGESGGAQGPAAVAAGHASAAAPNVGSQWHAGGRCKPCAFFYTKGCDSGARCEFCHLCDEGEKKRRRKEKFQFRSHMRYLRKLASENWSSGPKRR